MRLSVTSKGHGTSFDHVCRRIAASRKLATRFGCPAICSRCYGFYRSSWHAACLQCRSKCETHFRPRQLACAVRNTASVHSAAQINFRKASKGPSNRLGWAYLLGGVGLICNKQVQVRVGLGGSVHSWCKVCLVFILEHTARLFSQGAACFVLAAHISYLRHPRCLKCHRPCRAACMLINGVLW